MLVFESDHNYMCSQVLFKETADQLVAQGLVASYGRAHVPGAASLPMPARTVCLSGYLYFLHARILSVRCGLQNFPASLILHSAILQHVAWACPVCCLRLLAPLDRKCKLTITTIHAQMSRCACHPSEKEHAMATDQLALVISELMGW